MILTIALERFYLGLTGYDSPEEFSITGLLLMIFASFVQQGMSLGPGP